MSVMEYFTPQPTEYTSEWINPQLGYYIRAQMFNNTVDSLVLLFVGYQFS